MSTDENMTIGELLFDHQGTEKVSDVLENVIQDCLNSIEGIDGEPK